MKKMLITAHSKRFAHQFLIPIIRELSVHFETTIILGDTDSDENLEFPFNLLSTNLKIEKNPFKLIYNFFKLSNAIRKIKPEIIYTHTTLGATLPLVAAFLFRVPIRVYHNHGIPYLGHSGLLRMALQLIEKLNASLATSILGVSPSNTKIAIAENIYPKSKTHVLRYGSICGINPDIATSSPENRLKIITKHHISQNTFVVIFVGRPHKRKGFETLMRCWDKDFKMRTDFHLILLGIPEKILTERYRDIKNITSIEYTLDNYAYIDASDILVLPSYHEGLPYSILEAASLGKPIIATKIPGIDDLVVDGENGYLINIDNDKQLTSAIHELHKSRALREKLGAKGRQMVVEKFNQNDVIKETLSFFLKLK